MQSKNLSTPGGRPNNKIPTRNIKEKLKKKKKKEKEKPNSPSITHGKKNIRN